MLIWVLQHGHLNDKYVGGRITVRGKVVALVKVSSILTPHPILKGVEMIKIAMILLLIFSRIPLSGFQFLLLICLLEIETGVYIGDYYYGTLLFFYLLFNYLWLKTINAPIVQTG